MDAEMAALAVILVYFCVHCNWLKARDYKKFGEQFHEESHYPYIQQEFFSA